MDLGLEDKVALVTGSSRGIGRAIAARLAAEGARVALCSRDAEALEAAAAEIGRETGAAPLWFPCDLRDPEAVRTLVRSVGEQLGAVEVLVANAGGPPRGEFLAYSDEDWLDAFELSTLSVVRLVREVVPGMRERRSGSILTITSSSVRQPIEGHWLSNVMRPGVLGLVKTLAHDLAPYGVRVNNLAPGRILTERVLAGDRKRARERNVSLEEAQQGQLARVPMRRFGEPAEIADAAAFLSSERASYITGVTLHVDGGMVRSL